MVNRMWLFGIILAIPLIGFTVFEGIQAYFNHELRSAVRERFPNMDSRELSQLTIDRICEDPPPGFQDLCSTNRNLNLMSAGALLAGALGIALLIVIRVAGFASRTNRLLLLYLFKPGLYFTVLTLIVLVLIHAAVAMGAIYYAESILLKRVHIFIIGAIGIGAVIGILLMGSKALAIVQKARILVIGKEISIKQSHGLWQQVIGITKKLGALQPEHIVVGLDPNFFVTEAEVVSIDGKFSGRTLYCSLPLCRILSKEEFSAIIGHELGHFKGLDTKFSETFFPIYRGTVSSILSLQETGGEGARMIALLPAIAVLSYFLECFSVAESRISRSRELSADKEGGNVTNSMAMASALVKIHAFTGLWEELKKIAVEELQKGNYFVNASKTYAEAASKIATPNVFEGIAETHLRHPTDTHPPLSERLDGLGITIEDVSEQALDVTPNEPAIDLLEDATQIEEDISVAYQGILARELGIDLEHEETSLSLQEQTEDSSKKRISCSDGNCIGVINEKGICNICGKKYGEEVKSREEANSFIPVEEKEGEGFEEEKRLSKEGKAEKRRERESQIKGKSIPKFSNREEYEKWKAEILKGMDKKDE